MGWSTQAVIAQLVIIEGSNDGLFIYDGAAAHGNLIASGAPDPGGTDSAGNTYDGGLTSYGSTAIAQLVNGFLRLSQDASHTATGGHITWLSSGIMQLFSPKTIAGDISSVINMSSANASPTGQPYVQVQDGGGSFLIGAATGPGLWFLTPTGDATGVDDTANLAAVLSGGWTPVLTPGTYYLNCGNAHLTSLGPGQPIYVTGFEACFINALGSGDLFYWSETGTYNGFSTVGGGIIGGCTIDGGSTTGTATGVHAGDIESMRFEAIIQNFNNTASSCNWLFDNQNHFLERLSGYIEAKNGSHNVVFTVGGLTGASGATTSTKSFARPQLTVMITAGASNGNGVELLNGAQLYDGELNIRGNFASSASALTNSALLVSGTVPAGHPGAGTASKIGDGMTLNIGVECDSTHANRPATITYGSSANNIKAAGIMDFGANFAAASLAGGTLIFDGLIDGDTSLGSRFYYGENATQTITANGQTISMSGTSAVHPLACTANFTGLILSAGAFGGQVVWLVNTGTGSLTVATNLSAGSTAGLNAGASAQYVWDSGSALWYRNE